jgi:LysR family glycine cleavage system transcriptional activator
MAFRLPPLSSLRVFEAAARHNSFRKAADELNLTASAVSHGIQTLENWLGVELFHRGPRGLQLTDAGKRYAPMVNEALGLLAKATEQLPGRKATGTLSISSAPTFAHRILLPRLPLFSAQCPGLRISIDTSQRFVDLALDDVDVAIRFASIKKPEPNWTLLATETLTPVCSPALKRQFGGAKDDTMLSHMPLIHVTAASTDWAHWFTESGFEVPASISDGLRVDNIQMGFDAAIRGIGAVLGRSPLVDDDIASGRLVPLPGPSVPSGNAYWLVTAQTDFQKPEVKQFRRWLLSEFEGGGRRQPAKPAGAEPRTARRSSR